MAFDYSGRKRVFAGVHYGPRREDPVVVVLEWEAREGAFDRAAMMPRAEIGLRVQSIRRIPAGTPGEQAMRVRMAVAGVGGRSRVVVEGTKIGEGVAETLEGWREPSGVTLLTATEGGSAYEYYGHWKVWKEELVRGVENVMLRGWLGTAPTCDGGEELMKEVGAMMEQLKRQQGRARGVWEEMEKGASAALGLAIWAVLKEVSWAWVGEWVMYRGKLTRPEWGWGGAGRMF